MSVPNLLFSILVTVIIVFGVTYMCGFAALGIWYSRRQGVAMSGQVAQLEQAPDADAGLQGLSFYCMIPALDEERVIGGTITALLEGQAGVRVVVIDDGSSDRTPQIIDSFASTGRVVRLTRAAPNARQGKGRALNHGLEVIRAEVAARGLDPGRVVVGVIDADGRMTPNAASYVAGHFAGDPSIGGCQLAVRIRNHSDSMSLRFQDMSFWAICGLMQIGRNAVGSTAMGGNGQFTRLSTLNEVGSEPWSDSLTEDLDLGLSISILGWRSVAAAQGYVTQQGVNNFGRLVRQHTRWFQGHMMCMRRLPEMAVSRYLPTARFLELAMYLAVPWVLVLPWSIIQQYIFFKMLTGYQFVHTDGLNPVQAAGMWAIWFVFSFAPQLFWGVLYWRRTAGAYGFVRSMWLALLMMPWSYFGFICVWRALFRIVLRRGGWVKTAREVEDRIEIDPPTVDPSPAVLDAVT